MLLRYFTFTARLEARWRALPRLPCGNRVCASVVYLAQGPKQHPQTAQRRAIAVLENRSTPRAAVVCAHAVPRALACNHSADLSLVSTSDSLDWRKYVWKHPSWSVAERHHVLLMFSLCFGRPWCNAVFGCCHADLIGGLKGFVHLFGSILSCCQADLIDSLNRICCGV